MAAFTSQRTGNTSVPSGTVGSMWHDGGVQTALNRVPNTSDTVTLAHNCTVDANWDFGTSPNSGTPASNIVLTINNSIVMTIAQDVSVTVRGAIEDKNSNSSGLVMSAGSMLTIDATNAASAVNYVLSVGTTYVLNNAGGWTVNGTQAKPCTIRSLPSDGTRNARFAGATGGTTGEGSHGGIRLATWLNITNIGDGTLAMMAPRLQYSNQNSVWSDVNIDQCGQLTANYAQVDANAAQFKLTRCDSTNSRTNGTSTWPLSFSSSSTGTTATDARLLFGCSFDKAIRLANPKDLLIESNFFRKTPVVVVGTDTWRDFKNNFIYQDATGAGPSAMPLCGNFTDNYWLHQPAGTASNIRGISTITWGNSSITGNTFEWGDNIVSSGVTEFDGDVILPGGTTSLRTHTCTGNLFLPLPNGVNKAGQACSLLGNANTGVIWNNNTYFCDQDGSDPGGISVGETFAGFSGMVQQCRNNIAYGTSAGKASILARRNTGTVSDIATPGNCTNNCTFNAASGAVVTGYKDYVSSPSAPMFSNTTGLGAGDVNVDPQFVDMTRNIAKWALNRGSTATTYATRLADAVTYLQADPSLIASDLIPWVRGGFAPTNPAVRNASSTGGVIGAVAWVAASSGPATQTLGLGGIRIFNSGETLRL